MANGGNDWNSIMQSREARLVLYGISVGFCLFYAVDGILELMSPEPSAQAAQLIEAMGETGYYVMTVARTVVLLITGVAFGRMVRKTYGRKDEE